MRIAVIGAGGQLGSDLVEVLSSHDVLPFYHDDIEVSDRKSCEQLVHLRPEVVVNTAAYHRVDECEENPEQAFVVNAIGAKNIAEVCERMGACAVFISTDYVFDGTKGGPYTEEDCPSPLNTYGISKLAGEAYTRLVSRHYVFRVASLFGVRGASGKGGNFVETIVKKARAGESLTVVDDVVMSPTYTRDAATLIRQVLERELPHGVYHATNAGMCSWFEFACTIVKLVGIPADITPIKSVSLPQRARRPSFSALDSPLLRSHGLTMRHWREALMDYLAAKGHLQ